MIPFPKNHSVSHIPNKLHKHNFHCHQNNYEFISDKEYGTICKRKSFKKGKIYILLFYTQTAPIF